MVRPRRLDAPWMARALRELVAQDERMLHPMPHARRACAPESLQGPGAGAGDDRVRLLRLAVFEYARALEDERARLAAEPPGDLFDSDVRRGAVPPVDHQVFDVPFPVDITRIALGDGRFGELGLIGTLAVRLLIPRLAGEASIGSLFHAGVRVRDRRTGGRTSAQC